MPPNLQEWIGNVESAVFNKTGGVFQSHDHKVAVIVPSGAVPDGVTAEIKFAAGLAVPVKLPANSLPVSAIVWLCMDVVLQKPIKLYLPHMVDVKNQSQASNLHFAKIPHSLNSKSGGIVDGGQFIICETFGMIEIDHFCYYCIVNNFKAEEIPDNKYKILVMKYKKPQHDHWKCDVCILPSLITCIKVSPYSC